MNTFSIKQLAGCLEREVPEIDFAFIFGSAKTGDVDKNSDIDIGVYLNRSISLDLISKIVKIVEEATNSTCDLSILNSASELLRFEALTGRLLFVRENKMELYTDFYSITCREYEDSMIWMKKQRALRGYS